MQWDGKYQDKRLRTNNNCESINNVIIMKIHWKLARLLDLVNHLHDLVWLQYLDTERREKMRTKYTKDEYRTEKQTEDARQEH